MGSAYDSIIVGAGSAGCVLAARLSEDSERQVLLVEAGPDYPSVDELPTDLADGYGPSLTEHDWGLQATMVPGRQMPYPRGKVVGGTSAVNSIIAIRGEPEDFDAWAAAGNVGWSWSECLPLFRRLEDDRDAGGDLHGTGGPIPIVRWRDEELTPVQRVWRDACIEQGHPACEDFNRPGALGVGPWQMNREGRLRVSTAVGYLDPVRERPNLAVRSGCFVHRVVVEGNRAVGVELEAAGATEVVRADEVILAAGAVHSPAILLHSGVGPAAQLEELGIPVVLDRPGVGQHLVDHAAAHVVAVPRPGLVGADDPTYQVGLRFTTSAGVPRSVLHGYCATLGLDHPLVGTVDEDVDGLVMLVAGLMEPRSTGSVRLRSDDPHDPPDIDVNILSHPDDVACLADGLKQLWQLANAQPMQDVLDSFVRPQPETMAADELVHAYLQETAGHHVHPVGTCRMGPAGDREAVVDHEGRVRGLEGLRVADASIMPKIPSANTNLPVIMIGEKVADLIRNGELARSQR